VSSKSPSELCNPRRQSRKSVRPKCSVARCRIAPVTNCSRLQRLRPLSSHSCTHRVWRSDSNRRRRLSRFVPWTDRTGTTSSSNSSTRLQTVTWTVLAVTDRSFVAMVSTWQAGSGDAGSSVCRVRCSVRSFQVRYIACPPIPEEREAGASPPSITGLHRLPCPANDVTAL